MKKKICLLLCILLACLSFAGCSGKKDDGVDETTLTQAETIGTYFTQLFSSWEDENFETFLELSDYEMNYQILAMNYSNSEYGYPQVKIDCDAFRGMIKAWQAAEGECGTFRSSDEFQAEEKNGDIVVTATAKYKDRDADIAFTFDSDLQLESMDVSAHYSTGEILKKAGLNTLLGMGTVFAVLILLAFIISLMKYIPMIMDKLQGKKASVVEEKQTMAEIETVDVTDDLELVAVITAAIAASEGTRSDGFVVRSIRRRPNNNWK